MGVVLLAAVFAPLVVFSASEPGVRWATISGPLPRWSDASGAPSVDERGRRSRDPNDLSARRDLANALQASWQLPRNPSSRALYEGTAEDAIARSARLAPRRQAQQYRRVRRRQGRCPSSGFTQDLTEPSSPLSEPSRDPDPSSRRGVGTESELALAAQSAYVKQADAWESLTKLQPSEPSNYLHLGSEFSPVRRATRSPPGKISKLAPTIRTRLDRRQIRALKQGLVEPVSEWASSQGCAGWCEARTQGAPYRGDKERVGRRPAPSSHARGTRLLGTGSRPVSTRTLGRIMSTE